MSKFPKEYIKNDLGDPDAIFRPEYVFDSRGRLVLPLTPHQRITLTTAPGSKDVKIGSESEAGKPATDPGSLKTGSLSAETVITVGSTIRLDATLPAITIGRNPGGADTSMMMTDHYFVGVVDSAIQFGFFLKDYSPTLKKGDFIIGNWPTSGLLWKSAEGKLYVNGEITVAYGGTIGGWEIRPDELRAGAGSSRVGLRPGTWPLYAGNENPAIAPFRVRADGSVWATNFQLIGTSMVGNQSVSTVNSGVERANTVISSAFKIQREIQARYIIGNAAEPGLNLTRDYLGYHDGTRWLSYIGSDGRFLFQGNTTNFVGWDGSTLTVRGRINADDIVAGTLSVDRITAKSIVADKIADNTLTAVKMASDPGVFHITKEDLDRNEGWIFRLPADHKLGTIGIVLKDSNDVPILKMNANAFITRFRKAFAAACNEAGPFGDTWCQFFCEHDTVPGKNTGVIQLSNTQWFLFKRNPQGAIMRLYGGNPAHGDDVHNRLVWFNCPIRFTPITRVPDNAEEGKMFVHREGGINYLRIYLNGSWRFIYHS